MSPESALVALYDRVAGTVAVARNSNRVTCDIGRAGPRVCDINIGSARRVGDTEQDIGQEARPTDLYAVSVDRTEVEAPVAVLVGSRLDRDREGTR